MHHKSVKTVRHPRDTLEEKGLRAKKSFGQNFLSDAHHLHVIAQHVCALRKDKNTLVFELGAGLGALTRALLQEGAYVHAIERDRDLVPILRRDFADEISGGNLVIHEANASTFDFNAVCALNERFVLCGNLPYHLTSTLMLQAIDYCDRIFGAVYMIQAEVAERIVSEPNSKVYGLLSVLLQARFEVSMVHQVPRGAFWPVPNVDSSVIRLIPKAEQPDIDWPQFKSLVKMAFAQRRKTLRNAIAKMDRAEQAMRQANIDPMLRAENLTPQDFVHLSQHLRS